MNDAVLRVMPREMRMMSERILSLSSLPHGFFGALCDVVMYSQGMGLGGFARLLQIQPALAQADPGRMRLQGAVLNGAGQDVWVALPSILDLLGSGLPQLRVENVAGAEELAIAGPLGARLGLTVAVRGLELSAEPAAVSDPLLEQLLQEGSPVSAPCWWQVWALAQTALAPDTELSRRHAGAVIHLPDGTMIGRSDNDDETDARFILGTARTASAERTDP